MGWDAIPHQPVRIREETLEYGNTIIISHSSSNFCKLTVICQLDLGAACTVKTRARVWRPGAAIIYADFCLGIDRRHLESGDGLIDQDGMFEYTIFSIIDSATK